METETLIFREIFDIFKANYKNPKWEEIAKKWPEIASKYEGLYRVFALKLMEETMQHLERVHAHGKVE